MIDKSGSETTTKTIRDLASDMQDLVILYAEDDPTVRDQFSRFLSRRVRAVHAVDNGALGLEAFERHKPDLVITDILMPVMDGLSMAEKIKERHPTVPIVVTTAHSEASRLLEAIKVGIDHYMIKPIDLDAMRSTLARCARAIHSDRELRTAAAVMAATSEAVAVLDSRGAIVTVNPAFREITGWNEPLEGRDIVAMLAPDGNLPEWASRRTTRESWQGHATMRRADGTPFAAIGALDNISSDDGEVFRSVLIFTDISDYKRIEDQLHQAQKMQAIGQLTGGIAHDFNNLLGVIQGNAELFLDYADSPVMDSILRATARGAELTQALLAFSRQSSLQPRPVDLAELIANMKGMLTRTLGETIEIEIRIQPDLWITRADPGQIETALLNLIINARDAMPDGGELHIRCENVHLEESLAATDHEVKAGNYIAISVSDTGVGMSPEVLNRAQDPFFTTKDVGKGSGLGLAMVSGFAKQSGGFFEIDSVEGKGTTVRLHLPRSTQQNESAESETQSSRIAPGRGERVLLIEDNRDLLEVLTQMLRGMGYDPLGLSDATEALDLLEHEKFDVVLTDIVLPNGLSGPNFVRAAQANYPRLKAIFMTGYANSASREELPAKESIVLKKPFQKKQLADALSALLDRGPQP